MRKGYILPLVPTLIIFVLIASTAIIYNLSYRSDYRSDTNTSSKNNSPSPTAESTSSAEVADGQCRIYTRKGAFDKTKRKQFYPTKSGDYQIELKFKEGSDVRLREEKFISLCGEDLSQVNTLLNSYQGFSIQRLFTRSEDDLNQEYTRLKANNPDLADLNLWYLITLEKGTKLDTVDKLINKLNEFGLVEIAQPRPKPAPLP